MKLSLVVLTPGANQGKALEIKLSQFVVGRDPQCHLRPASPMISKRHCALLQRDGKAFVRDFDSTNGTFVNNAQIKGEVELHDGDQLKIGPLLFIRRRRSTARRRRRRPRRLLKQLSRSRLLLPRLSPQEGRQPRFRRRPRRLPANPPVPLRTTTSPPCCFRCKTTTRPGFPAVRLRCPKAAPSMRCHCRRK